MTRPIIKVETMKSEYIPSPYTYGSLAYKSKEKEPRMPSRAVSQSTGSSRGKYEFGKYLKMDKDALSHF